MLAFVRDMSFQILGMGLYYHFMEIQSLTLGQCICLMAIFVIYIAVICIQQYYQNKLEKDKEEAIFGR